MSGKRASANAPSAVRSGCDPSPSRNPPIPMPPVLKFLFSMAALAAVAAVSPFAGEAAMRFYDKAFDPYTAPGAISVDGQPVKFGPNRRLFRENRFPFVMPEVRMELTGLTEDEAIHAPTPVRGALSAYLLPSPTNAVPGREPPPEAVKLASCDFRLEPIRTRPSSDAHPHLIVAATAVDALDETPPAEEGPATYDVLCALVPSAEADKQAWKALADRIFEAGTPLEFDVEVPMDIPCSNRLVFAYSRPTRSLLRGTRLEPVYDRILGALSKKE